jgi:hypothetical protein
VDPERVASSLIALIVKRKLIFTRARPKGSVARYPERLSNQISNRPMAAVRLKVSILTEPPARTLFPPKRSHARAEAQSESWTS